MYTKNIFRNFFSKRENKIFFLTVSLEIIIFLLKLQHFFKGARGTDDVCTLLYYIYICTLSLSLSAEVVKRQRKGGNRQEIRGGIPSSVGDLNLH